MQSIALLWLASIVGAVLILVVQLQRTLTRPRRSAFAPATGSEAHGMRYALLEGMAPQAKESVRTHLGTYIAGVLYHAGLGAALLLGFGIALSLAFPGSRLLGGLALLGASAGLGLLAKRLASPLLRPLSSADDYLANLLTTGFALAMGLATWGRIGHAWAFGIGIALMLYVPMGKIRHCIFFVPTRLAFGRFFGRRGVLPPIA